MRIVRVSGYHNSGKTTVVQVICEGLQERGYTVSTAKAVHIEGWSIDQSEKDSKKHANAGAKTVGIIGLNESVLIFPNQKRTLEEMLPFFQTDYLVLEGFAAKPNIPNILCARNREDVDALVSPVTFCVSGLLSEGGSQEVSGLPVANARRDTEMILDLVEKHSQDLDE